MQEVGWEFEDRTLLAAARAGDGTEFQRLELLGDAVADAVLLPWLYSWSTGTVAVLAGARQQLTSDATLDHLSVLTGAHGALPADLRSSASHRADMIEALVGAAYVDGGWPAATAVCETVFGAWLSAPSGVADSAARIDTSVTPDGDRWRWRTQVWTTGTDAPQSDRGDDTDPVAAELAALTAGVHLAGRAPTAVWLEVSDDLRAAMVAGRSSPHADAIQVLRALLAAYDGVWFVPGDRLDTSLDPWAPDLVADGILTPFETSVGHDLVRSGLERLALHPGSEQRRLAFVGGGILKTASAVRACEAIPSGRVKTLHDAVHAELALDRLHRAAFAAGLVDLLFPGTRPTDPVALIRAVLGATAVDAGPAHAVGLAATWLDAVRIENADLDHVCVIECHLDTAPGGDRRIEIVLVTPDETATWTLVDDTVDHHALAIEGLCAALDCIDDAFDDTPILVGAPAGVVRAVDGPGVPRDDPDTAAAVARFLHRIDQRGLCVLWHGPVQGVTRADRRPDPTQTRVRNAASAELIAAKAPMVASMFDRRL
ncbi:MAG: ribonuclease III domain-containing protein [Acidimicrobiales bacterium]